MKRSLFVPNSPAAIKDLRQSEKRYARNQAAKSRMRTQIKKALVAVNQGDRDRAVAEDRSAESVLDKSAQRGIISKNAASRKKSRLAKKVNALSSGQ
ncbi:MAG: 30S ribosomal protein S20 [Armatimonadetes bacterium]|nr:30S ribosomal protein S20 [Armatimonadota bacterium]PIU62166.1 MAG: 30S ribosomal protein S20 [Armatimonadetes bacterium CG07_land_8_20_14_0_80_59_28]PIY41097.1 MAG: 30S ribosomal protein S20 [Armatimonadetes bacterium CG_4_10_14_3_um_filter_59_10]PJB63842.1 MAG: 30S ribosomal protein S20 [Armatimonadetes bacterium CG_4_9_14_3_um_filter_58_7]